jgi:hypothetical protein
MSRLAVSLAVIFAGWAAIATGQDLRWQPTQPEEPAVTLGPPVAAQPGPVVRAQSADDGFQHSRWAAATPDATTDSPPPVPPLQVPSFTGPTSAVNYPDPPLPIPPSSDPIIPGSGSKDKDRNGKREHKSYFGDMFQGWGGAGPEGKCFESDHCFDYFASPVSNPFYFEDPRSLTEVRPIILFQTIPHNNPVYHGGNAEFYGVQARLAITDQWSFVLNKLGGVSINPGSDSPLGSENGFAEIWLGPKFTFLRNTQTGTVAAAGVTFELPTGSSKVAQDTGTLSVVPYVTAAQNFGCTSYGSFNAMATIGYGFRTDSERTDFLFTSWHLDFDVGNQHRLYPLVELNWFHYTRNGGERPFNFEGGDLANFGSTDIAGRNSLTLATGLRYKFTENIQTGLSLQFPLGTSHEFQSFRLGVDLIFRY